MADPVADLACLVGVAEAAADARLSIDRALRDRGLRDLGAPARAAAAYAAAQANASLTGAPDRWLPGCLRLQIDLVRLSPLILRTPGQWLARAHVLVTAPTLDEVRLGRPRPDPVVTTRLDQLTRLLISPTKGPAVVLAGVVHAELLTLAPFGVADEVLARAAEHAVLIATGVDPRGAIAVAVGHADRPEEYRAALRGYVEGTAAGVRAWLLHGLTALGRAADRSPGIWRDGDAGVSM